MEPFKVNREVLEKLGIAFENEEETIEFSRIVQGVLETRIGNAISKVATTEQLEEFDNASQEEEAEILKKICPNYKSVVRRFTRQIKEELLVYRDEIPGNTLSGKKKE